MKPTVRPLTLADAQYVAANLCASHRADILLDCASVEEWAQSRMQLQGSAWVFVTDRPIFAGGLVTSGAQATLWLAGCEGWTRYARHAMRIAKAVLKSGSYEDYMCETRESDAPARRFAERLGFRLLDVRSGIVYYGAHP